MPTTPDRRVRVVVVAWNNRDVLPSCLDHLRATSWPADQLEVVVVDNGSTDGSVDDLEARFPGVVVRRNVANLGFAGGVNTALGDLDGVWAVALVNSDAFVEPGWLEPLAAALEDDPVVGAASPKILFEALDAGGRPVINNVGVVLGPTWELHDRGYGEVDDGQFDAPEDVWAWCGGAVLLRADYLRDVGLLDSRLFMYAEDVDLSWRGAKRGWRYRYEPRSVVRHVHGASSGGERTPLLDYLNRRNRIVVVGRHAGWPGRIAMAVRVVGGIIAAAGALLPALRRGRRADPAALRRRVRAAADAVRILAGGSPRLPHY
ncbi:MAG: glycosyltransferase family 2 protein [Actinomycetota bacterium]|nr:glycosyltransferase family 2 protein [Actinomycetota bacterium]